jgi:hypothetical protein
MSKRSRLNKLFERFYEVKQNKFVDALDKDKAENIIAEAKIKEGEEEAKQSTIVTDYVGRFRTEKSRTLRGIESDPEQSLEAKKSINAPEMNKTIDSNA